MHTLPSQAPLSNEFPPIVMQGQTDEQARHTLPHPVAANHHELMENWRAVAEPLPHLPPDEPVPREAPAKYVCTKIEPYQCRKVDDACPKLPTNPELRKALPICTGVLDYFPDAIAAVAECSKIGNDQHNPGQPLHWAREKSTDHADCLVRHLMERGTRDLDGIRHTAKVAWRALALLQLEIERGKCES